MTQNNLQISTTGNLLTVLFKNPSEAEKVYTQLLNQGYEKEDISLAMSEQTKDQYFSNKDINKSISNERSNILEGTGVGGTIGATVGAISAALAAAGTSLVIPGLGIVVSGALAASLAGAGAGATAGGIVGALIGAGLADDTAQACENELKEGNVLLALKTESEEEAQQVKTKLQNS